MKTFNEYLNETNEIGYIVAINNTVVSASGLPHARPWEVVVLETGELGFILGLHKEYCDILLFSRKTIKNGTRITRTNQILSIFAGKHFLGKTIDPFGNAFDSSIDINPENVVELPIDIPPGGISTRKRINKTFETGVALVDLVLPLGKGQRELVIGDRKTGKTNFLLQTILAQATLNTICIYVAIGKKQLSFKRIEEYLKAHQIMEQCIIVASTAQDPPGTIFLSPYTGMTLAEYFRDLGKDVLIIFDDLTTHAKYYRQINLLMKRFPGRNSYPADIFYVHARLLERAGNFSAKKNPKDEHSITCIPVAETVQGDLSGYIQTNLMAITDGHLFFDIDLFGKGRRPPIHPFLSVTRVGRQTQNSLRQTLNREIISFLSLYEKMQNFTHFGAEVNETISSTLKTGSKITSFFDQISSNIVSLDLQIFLFSLLWVDIWREKTNETMKKDMDRICELYKTDEAFRKDITDILGKSESFNNLLGEVRGKDDGFYKKLGL
jgi:F-type H+/Na+-transporting ATPase subunit alpha